MTLLKSKPVMTFGNTEIFVVNTFLHVGNLDAQLFRLFPKDVAVKSDCEDPPVMPWKTYDSYDEICEEEHLEPMVGKAQAVPSQLMTPGSPKLLLQQRIPKSCGANR
eukprot:Skav234642  [mRNA]  locus=scaffold1609:292580:293637:+ [translate_table: standard]